MSAYPPFTIKKDHKVVGIFSQVVQGGRYDRPHKSAYYIRLQQANVAWYVSVRQAAHHLTVH